MNVESHIKARILGDLTPVEPLAPSWRRTLFLVPWIGFVALVIAAAGMRPDMEALGVGWSWGASGLFVAFGTILFFVAIRETVPGAGFSTTTVWSAMALLLGAQTVVAAALHHDHPASIPAGEELKMAGACLGAIGLLALPALTLGCFLAQRALPSRPALCGVVFGVSVVAIVEGCWRLHCPFTDPGHLVVAHAGVYGLGLLGAAVLSSGANRRYRRLHTETRLRSD